MALSHDSDAPPLGDMMELRGKKLELAQTLLVVLPSFILFGYNQSGIGGLLSVESWVETFPRIDTIHTKGAQKQNNSTVQVSRIAGIAKISRGA